MPWQQIKLKSAWKKEALKCCHMQDCMGTSWGTHVVLGLSERCWVCVVYRVRHSIVYHSPVITENSNSWMTIIFSKNVIFKTCQFWTGQWLLDTIWHVTWDSQFQLDVECLDVTCLVLDIFVNNICNFHHVADELICWQVLESHSLQNLICLSNHRDISWLNKRNGEF